LHQHEAEQVIAALPDYLAAIASVSLAAGLRAANDTGT